MKVPVINWIPFDAANPPANLNPDGDFLLLLREDDYNDGATWYYSVDIGTPYGSYIDNFWDTTNDWREGQRVEVIAYAELPYYVAEKDLVEHIVAAENKEPENAELKFCPFCGGEAKLVETTECWGHGEFHKVKYVACERCGSKGHTVCDMDIYDGYADSLDDAIKHWNVRC